MKIDLSGLKGIVGKLGALRSFSSLVLPLAILAAGVLVLAAALVLGSGFRQKVQKESVAVGRQLSGMVDAVPPLKQIEEEKRYIAAYEKDANTLEQLVMQTTMRPLLSYGMFPTPQDVSTLIFSEFGRTFCKSIEDLIADVNGRDCPSDEEINRATNKTGGGQTRSRFGHGASTGPDAAIIDALCREKAESARVYVGPANIAGYEFWANYKYTNMDQGLKECWYWQVGYWIIEDVMATIKAMNEGSVNVYSSPVKRLTMVAFAQDERGYGMRRTGTQKGPVKPPAYAAPGKNMMAQSPTGRISNSEVDVVQFNVTAIVAATEVGRYMAELCAGKEHEFRGWTGTEEPRRYKRNQIAIIEYKVKSIDRNSSLHDLYRYGSERYREDAVVEVDAVCEYIFQKAVYDSIKPEVVKKDAEAAQPGR